MHKIDAKMFLQMEKKTKGNMKKNCYKNLSIYEEEKL